MLKEYPYGFFITRGQPPHKAHIGTIRKGLQAAERVAVLIGSCRQAATPKNPFSFEQRKAMFESCFTQEELKRLAFYPVRDYPYSNTAWAVEVQRIISDFTEGNRIPRSKWNESMALFGHDKDRSTFYLNMFPQLRFVETGWDSQIGDVCATDVRTSYFEGRQSHWDYLPEEVNQWLLKFEGTHEFVRLVEEWDYIKHYRASWASAPYVPIFSTADAVIVQSSHVLLVIRGGKVGNGLYALPGGFLEPHETLLECALREAKEETGLKINRNVLLGHLQAQHTFDHPNRDERGRFVTETFGFKLPDNRDRMLPAIRSKGGDDAKGALWMSLHDVTMQPERFAFDHWHIINYMAARLEDRIDFTFRAETTAR